MSAEQVARQTIDGLLAQAGSSVQGDDQTSLHAASGLAIPKYAQRLPAGLAAWRFVGQPAGNETHLTNGFDSEPHLAEAL